LPLPAETFPNTFPQASVGKSSVREAAEALPVLDFIRLSRIGSDFKKNGGGCLGILSETRYFTGLLNLVEQEKISVRVR